MAIGLFPSEFCSRWEVQNTITNSGDSNLTYVACGKNKRNVTHHIEGIRFGEVNKTRVVYTAKAVAPNDLPWSRFEFVTAPKSKKFSNGNSSVIHNRNRQRRSHRYRLGELPDGTRSQIAS